MLTNERVINRRIRTTELRFADLQNVYDFLEHYQPKSVNQTIKFIVWVTTQNYNVYNGSIQNAAIEALISLNPP